MTTAHDKLPSIVAREADTDVDMDVARAQLRGCAETVGTLLPIASAKTLADALDVLTAERDELARVYQDATDIIKDAIGGDFETLAEGAGRLAEICAAHRDGRDDLHRKHEAVKIERDALAAQLADMSENAAGAWCVLGKKACTPECRCLVHAEADKAAADHAVAEAAWRWFEHHQQHHDHECDGADCTLFAALDARRGGASRGVT